MKKIIITCFLLINIWPCIFNNEVKITCTEVSAQRHRGSLECFNFNEPGASIFTRLGRAIGKAFGLIRGFFAAPDGEEPAGEGFGFASEESWQDFCDAELFADEDLSDWEEDVLDDLPDMLNVYNANKDDTDRYYLTLASAPNNRYYNTAKMYIQQSSVPVKVIVHRESLPINIPAVTWERNDIDICPQTDTCSFLPSQLGETIQKIKISNTIELQNKIIVEEAPKYYLTLQGYPKKYYEGDSIFVPIQRQQVKLYVHYEGGAVNTSGLAWKRNDTVKCNTVNNCLFAATQMGVTTIKVDSGNNVLLTKNPLVVYKQPTLYFKRGFNYDGEYGFDDSTHQYLNIRNANNFKNGYEVKHIMDDPNYFVPWMSLLHQQTAVTIKDSLANFSSWAKKDVNAYVEFKTNTNKILANPTKQYYSGSSTINPLTMYAEKWSEIIETQRKAGVYDSLTKAIYAITSTGDTIGQMNLTCSSPEPKPITFIYVNLGNGYDSSILSRVNMLNKMNNHSHNQIFRKWNALTEYADTLNLTVEYAANPEYFTYEREDSMIIRLRFWYLAHTGININQVNYPPLGPPSNNSTLSTWKRFAFIVPIEMRKDSISTVTGDTIHTFIYGAFYLGATTGVFYKKATVNTFGHEAGHALRLDHTWELPFIVPQYTTKNIMDYLPLNGTARLNQFWYGQWIKVY